MLFAWPENAHYGRVVPKNTIYAHTKPTRRVRDLFIQQVEQITWTYKLAPETINLPATDTVLEIQVFRIGLRQPKLADDVLLCIDQGIRHPIFFEVHYQGRCQTKAAYKRPYDTDKSKWITTGYFTSPWVQENKARMAFPVALNLSGLFGQLLAPLLPFAPRPGEPLRDQMARVEEVQSLERELAKCQAALRREKQFNRKMPLHSKCQTLQEEIINLSSASV